MSLNEYSETEFIVYESQVSVDAVYRDNVRIWSRPETMYGNRRLLKAEDSLLTVDFTLANVDYHRAMPMSMMLEDLRLQLIRPASSLYQQPLFRGSVIHDCSTAPATSNYSPPMMNARNSLEESAAVAPLALFSIVISIFNMILA